MRLRLTYEYVTRIEGNLSADWSEWLDGIAITHDLERAETILSGLLPDQAALLGVLLQIHSLNLQLVAVQRIPKPPL